MEISSIGPTSGPSFKPSREVNPKELSANLATQNQQIQQQLQITSIAITPPKNLIEQLSKGITPSSNYTLTKPGQEKNSTNTYLLQGIQNLDHPQAEAALNALNPINLPQISFSTALIIALILASVSESASKQNEQFLILGAQISNQGMEQAQVTANATIDAANASAQKTIDSANATIAEAWIMVGITIATSVLTMGVGDGLGADAEAAEGGTGGLEAGEEVGEEVGGKEAEIEMQDMSKDGGEENDAVEEADANVSESTDQSSTQAASSKTQMQAKQSEATSSAQKDVDSQAAKSKQTLDNSASAGGQKTANASSPQSGWTRLRKFLGSAKVKAAVQMAGTSIQATATTLIQKIIMQTQVAEDERRGGRASAIVEMSKAVQGQFTAASQQLDNSSKQTAQYMDKLQQVLQQVQTQNQNQFRG
jgi:hypothetical protein